MKEAGIFTRDNSLLIVVDIQEKLAHRMPDKEKVLKNSGKLIQVTRRLEIPVIVTEQYPKGLGRIVPELESLVMDTEPIDKISFSCCLEDRFINALAIENRNHILITGMEAHICVMQTALDLVNNGYTAGVVQDAVCSFHQNDMDIALERMHAAGVILVTTEMVIYELLRKAGTEDFKALLPMLKER